MVGIVLCTVGVVGAVAVGGAAVVGGAGRVRGARDEEEDLT
jgi:hypothetical protein